MLDSLEEIEKFSKHWVGRRVKSDLAFLTARRIERLRTSFFSEILADKISA